MKTLTYSIAINRSPAFVFSKVTDKSVYPGWAKAWGEGMTYLGDWTEGTHISFVDKSQGGTKALIEEIVSGESIKMKHVAMVGPDNIELEPSDDMMRKWIGSRENYFFKASTDGGTLLDVEVVTDEAFEEMMQAWTPALQFLKEICET